MEKYRKAIMAVLPCYLVKEKTGTLVLSSRTENGLPVQWLKITETLPLITPVGIEAEGRTVLIEQNLIEYDLST